MTWASMCNDGTLCAAYEAAIKERDEARTFRDANERGFYAMEKELFIERAKSAKLVQGLRELARDVKGGAPQCTCASEAIMDLIRKFKNEK